MIGKICTFFLIIESYDSHLGTRYLPIESYDS